ncbi:hypothetical protein RM550_29175 [Streptomyces sp. DSM 41527]|uniref:DUF2511 domain-containing protein n=1 Tax=Streptomyces mooreae TaxID=3075523 RepID=A0ABU2TFM4_9ACTN|nr:hypothetical protein [Streptomyces sp. DSM 41527]MDT0459742.1 hypothetical protein [Streptomyces sp. DSM 41527]
MTTTCTTRVRALAAITAGLSISLLVSGCSQESDAVLKWPAVTSNPQRITSDQFGAAWPVKPKEGKVGCDTTRYSGFAITFTAPDGKIYALNNVAHDEQGYPKAETIRGPSSKTMWRLRSFGMQVCSVDRAKRMQSTPKPSRTP